MEYAAMGLPAVAARTSAIERYFEGTMVTLFVPGDVDSLAQCILDLYASPEKRATLARGSEKFNEHYSWTRIGAEYKALVEQLGGRRVSLA
jgi:glycosyltransferase involved in cell wall biosynthesis